MLFTLALQRDCSPIFNLLHFFGVLIKETFVINCSSQKDGVNITAQGFSIYDKITDDSYFNISDMFLLLKRLKNGCE